MFKFAAVPLVMTIIFVLFACQPESRPKGPLEATQLPAPAEVKESWELEWNKILKAAKQEKSLVIYGYAEPRVRQALIDALRDKFGLDLEYVSGRGGEIEEKIIRERRAGLYLVDIYLTSPRSMIVNFKPAGILQSLKPVLILPEVLNPKAWWEGEMPFVDKEKQYIVMGTVSPTTGIVINTSLIKKEEVKSFEVLLDPRWKGKVAMTDPTKEGPSNQQTHVLAEAYYGYDFLKKLVETKPDILSDERVLAGGLAQGKYAIAIGLGQNHIQPFVDAGAPLTSVQPKGTYVSSGATSLSLIDKALHINAAKLFANWFLTKEGQTIYSKAYLAHSTRVDVPIDFLPEFRIRKPGQEYYRIDNEDFYLRGPEYNIKVKEIFGPLLK